MLDFKETYTYFDHRFKALKVSTILFINVYIFVRKMVRLKCYLIITIFEYNYLNNLRY